MELSICCKYWSKGYCSQSQLKSVRKSIITSVQHLQTLLFTILVQQQYTVLVACLSSVLSDCVGGGLTAGTSPSIVILPGHDRSGEKLNTLVGLIVLPDLMIQKRQLYL